MFTKFYEKTNQIFHSPKAPEWKNFLNIKQKNHCALTFFLLKFIYHIGVCETPTN